MKRTSGASPGLKAPPPERHSIANGRQSCSEIRTRLLKIQERWVKNANVRSVVNRDPFGNQNRAGPAKCEFERSQSMDVMKMLTELRQEREHIEEAILTLERLARGRGKRRGRPPAWMSTIKRRGRPPGSKNKPKDLKASAA